MSEQYCLGINQEQSIEDLKKKLTLYPIDCLIRDKGCGNSLVGLTKGNQISP